MKRILIPLLVFVLIFSGCSSAPEPNLSQMLGTLDGSTYCSPLGIAIDLDGMTVHSEEDLAILNRLDGGAFTTEALMAAMDKGNAVAILSASSNGGFDSMTLSLVPHAQLSDSIRDAADYADHAMSVIPGKLENIGCTDIRIERITVTLDGIEHPAVLCSCSFVDGSAYHLLEVCFRHSDWMSGLSLTSLESEEALRQLLSRVSAS